MTELSMANRVWNRACELVGRPGPQSGDTELSAMLLAHNITMNGGVLHCVEALSAEELEPDPGAVALYRRYQQLYDSLYPALADGFKAARRVASVSEDSR